MTAPHSRQWIQRHHHLKIFTGTDALSPCMIKFRVANISTFLEPSATATATAGLTRFLMKDTLSTYTAAICPRQTGICVCFRGEISALELVKQELIRMLYESCMMLWVMSVAVDLWSECRICQTTKTIIGSCTIRL